MHGEAAASSTTNTIPQSCIAFKQMTEQLPIEYRAISLLLSKGQRFEDFRADYDSPRSRTGRCGSEAMDRSGFAIS